MIPAQPDVDRRAAVFDWFKIIGMLCGVVAGSAHCERSHLAV
jgi:hypothetical protein